MEADQPDFQVIDQVKGDTRFESIAAADIKPEIPEPGGTVIVLQRNASDRKNRTLSSGSPDFGALDPGEADATKAQATQFFNEVFSKLTPEERKTVDILVIGSDATLIMPDGKVSPHKRTLETAEQVLAGVKESMAKNDFHETQIETQILNKNEKPIELTSGRFTDLKMLKDSPEFVKYMVSKYGSGREFWQKYEEDVEKETREKMDAEGPVEVANRIRSYMGVLNNAMMFYHESHPGKRVFVWVNGHYDSISPYLKQYVIDTPMTKYLPVENRGGVVFNVGSNGKAVTEIQGKKYAGSLAA